jgi:acylphosphatase
MQEICINYTISGRVQGVCYRSFAINKANALGITGWTRNLSNGNVEVFACGTIQQLSEFEDKLKHGPAAARVDVIQGQKVDFEKHENFITKPSN